MTLSRMPCNFRVIRVVEMRCSLSEADHGQGRTSGEETGPAVTVRWPATGTRRGAGRSGAAGGHIAHHCELLARTARGRWARRATSASARSAGAARYKVARDADASTQGWGAGGGSCHRAVDAAPGQQPRRMAHWTPIHREPRVAHLDVTRLPLPTPWRAGTRAQ